MKDMDETHTLQILKSILDINQKLTGIEYLKELIKNIALNLDVKYAFIGHPLDGLLSQIQTDVVWANGEYIDNFKYQLKDTPCEVVLSGERVCIHKKNVCKDFPDDKLLQEMGIEAYIGAPVVSKSPSGVSSILVLLDDKPIKNKDFFIAITDFLAMRASAEIEKYHIEENLMAQVNQRTLELEQATEEIKKNQKKIEDINSNLEIRIKEEVEENKRNQEIIYYQSKMAALGEMLENIAHQWRQPLSIISVTATGMKLKSRYDLIEGNELYESFDSINNAVQHLSQTITDFRDYFIIDKIKKEFSLTNTFKKTFKLIEAQLNSYQISLVKNIEEILVVGLENELIQVLINILNNAREQLIRENIEYKVILVDVIKKNNFLEISIKDNAGGIPDDIMDEIFVSHFTTKKDIDGTGIGLYMSKMIVTDHMNGTITANNVSFIHENHSYNGAEFKICLPL